MDTSHKRKLNRNEAVFITESLTRDMPHVRLTEEEWNEFRAFLINRLSNVTVYLSPAGVEIDATKQE